MPETLSIPGTPFPCPARPELPAQAAPLLGYVDARLARLRAAGVLMWAER